MAKLNIAAFALLSLAVLAPALAITDPDILNFALNLEYLEAEFYVCATTGMGIPTALRGGGPASIGCEMANLTGSVKIIAEEIAADELAHVVYLRAALGADAVAMPLVNIGVGPTGAFSVAANAALNTTLSPPFSPYGNNILFLHGAYIFEDVGVTAYTGAAALIVDKALLTAAAGILAIEGYHAGTIREQLIQNSSYVVPAYGVEVNVIVGAISALRATLSGAADDSGILVNGTASLVPTDMNAITFTRNVSQIISIVTAGSTTGKGLFFPDGLNGVINGSTMAASAPMATAMSPGMAMSPAMAMAGRKMLAHVPAPAMAAGNLTDVDILNFALNLEYLEAEFYSFAALGRGIPSQYRGGGPTSVGGRAANLTSAVVKAFAMDTASDELSHVIFLRAALGAAAAPMPLINLNASFAAAANAALNTTLSPPFSPFGSDTAFLLGSFIFEDVGVTAYAGAAALISNKAYLTAAAGILAVEAYHAGAVRTLLFQRAATIVAPYGAPVSAITGAISALRNTASGSPVPPSDQNIVNGTMSNIAPADANSLAFTRTPAQVVSIAVLGTSSGMGGFLPNGLNGVINGTSASIGSVASLNSASAAMSPSMSMASPPMSGALVPATSASPSVSMASPPTASAPLAAAPLSATSMTPPPPASAAFSTAVPSMAAVAIGIASTLAMLV